MTVSGPVYACDMHAMMLGYFQHFENDRSTPEEKADARLKAAEAYKRRLIANSRIQFIGPAGVHPPQESARSLQSTAIVGSEGAHELNAADSDKQETDPWQRFISRFGGWLRDEHETGSDAAKADKNRS